MVYSHGSGNCISGKVMWHHPSRLKARAVAPWHRPFRFIGSLARALRLALLIETSFMANPTMFPAVLVIFGPKPWSEYPSGTPKSDFVKVLSQYGARQAARALERHRPNDPMLEQHQEWSCGVAIRGNCRWKDPLSVDAEVRQSVPDFWLSGVRGLTRFTLREVTLEATDLSSHPIEILESGGGICVLLPCEWPRTQSTVWMTTTKTVQRHDRHTLADQLSDLGRELLEEALAKLPPPAIPNRVRQGPWLKTVPEITQCLRPPIQGSTVPVSCTHWDPIEASKRCQLASISDLKDKRNCKHSKSFSLFITELRAAPPPPAIKMKDLTPGILFQAVAHKAYSGIMVALHASGVDVNSVLRGHIPAENPDLFFKSASMGKTSYSPIGPDTTNINLRMAWIIEAETCQRLAPHSSGEVLWTHGGLALVTSGSATQGGQWT